MREGEKREREKEGERGERRRGRGRRRENIKNSRFLSRMSNSWGRAAGELEGGQDEEVSNARLGFELCTECL